MQELLDRLNTCQTNFLKLEKYSEAWYAMNRMIDSLVNQLETKYQFSAVLNPRTNEWS